ncbi:MAG: hypothetical protein A2X59_03775 [Nitrospirae bacterium GWC2_42_7]|nr:MAG: hypothetical protein A2X59_03775 [Nitrospirae bacterium GWC2_42_7]
MKRDNFRDKTSLFLAGKELLIILVVIFSALSFTFGYFVGKFGKEEPTENDFQSSTPSPQLPEPQEIPSTTNTSEQEVSIEDTSQSLQDIKPDQPQTVPVPEETSKETQKQAVKKNLKVDTKADASSPLDIKPQKNETLYTVQLNALRNSVEAEKFMAKYEKKGYKTYIVVSTDKKRNNIYKIRTGEFKNKQDADILSLKIRKAEGLSTFVTMKNR